MQHLFVYGSLAPGKANSHWLAPLKGRWQKAWARGHLFRHGKLGTHGYPAFIPENNAPWQAGLLFSHPKLSNSFWQALDQFEGAGYERKLINIKLANKSEVEAHVYAYLRATIGHNCP